MSALSTYMGSTELTQVIPTELIDTFVASYQYATPVGMAVAWARPGQGSIAVRFPRWNQLDGGSGVPASTKAQTAPFSDVLLDTTESSITPGIVGFRLPISDEAQVQTLAGVPAAALEECIRALVDRMDSDVLASSTSASHSTGTAGDTFSLSAFRSAVASYKALEVPDSPAGHACVLGHASAADLLDSLHASSATMSTSAGDSLGLGAVPGYLGRLHGFECFETGNLAQESTADSNFMTPIGAQRSGLGLVLQEMPNMRPTRGDDAESRAVSYVVCRAWYGTGITNPGHILEILAN